MRGPCHLRWDGPQAYLLGGPGSVGNVIGGGSFGLPGLAGGSFGLLPGVSVGTGGGT